MILVVKNNIKFLSFYLNTFLGLCCLCFFVSCSEKIEPQLMVGETMGTVYRILYMGKTDAKLHQELQQKIDKRLVEINHVFSTYELDSEITLFNQHKSLTPFTVSDEFFAITSYALELASKSYGTFDPTIGPLVNLWGFGPGGKRKKPSEEDIEKARSITGHHLVKIDKNTKTLTKIKEDVYLDLSACAKGYGVDQVADVLLNQGFTNFMIEIGGEVRTSGLKNGKKWRIGIERPDESMRAVKKIIEAQNIAMATSGNYRNFFKENNNYYSHTIDPKTGHPVPNNLASVTVIHPTSTTEADAWATVLMVLGPEQGPLLAEREGIGALFLIAERISENTENKIKFTEKMSSHFEKILKNK